MPNVRQGGLRAVVWTDSVQTGVMFIGVLLVAAAGTLAVGGVDAVLGIANESGRLQLSKYDFINCIHCYTLFF